MNTESFKRRLAAILSADVEGYSLLMREDEEWTIRTITEYRKAVATLIEKYRGRVVDSPGDNVLAEFTSVVDAVNCAVEVQRELAERNAELSGERKMQFRIGVNLGDVIDEGERIYGDGVNVAARMESLSKGGEICISGTVYDAIESKIGLEYDFLGEQTVKNIPKPVRAYRVLTTPGAAAHRVRKAKRAVKRTRLKTALAIAAVVIIAAGAWAVWQFELRPTIPSVEPASEEKMAYPLPDKPSIAVLPFENLSDDPAQENIVDGITDAIITGLSRTPEMFVIARNSVFTYKGKPVKVKQVSEDLGVRYVLEGSVQKEGDRLRINAQLIDAIKGHHLWAGKYNRDLKDLFALQDEITMKIIESLQVNLTEGSYARVLAKGTKNLEAYLKCLNAIHIFRRITKEDNFKARKMFEEVIALDPDYPRPYIYLGWTHLLDVQFGWSKSPKKDLARAEDLAKKALELDASLGMLHRLLADIYMAKRQWDKGLSEAELAVSIDPNSLNMYGLAWHLCIVERHEESIALFNKAFRSDPNPPANYIRMLGVAYLLAERYEEALVEYKRALRKGGFSPKLLHRDLAITYAMLGQEKKAQYHVDEVLKIDPKYSLERYAKMTRHGLKNQAGADRLINALRKAGLPEEAPLPLPDKPSIAVLPFTNMSDDPKQEYFSDGMTDDLITDLSKISGLFVIARNSVFQYKGRLMDAKKVSRELGVRYLVEGSVRRADNQVRINAQLIDATTGGHLWAERYDGKMDDIFALQDRINQKIVAALAVELTGDEQENVKVKETDNIAAYDAFLRGWAHYLRWTPEDFIEAISNFEKAVELDPKYWRAYAALARTYENASANGWHSSLKISYMEARLRTRQYLEIAMKNPTSLAHQVAADMELELWQHDVAIGQAERAVALDPNDPTCQAVMAWVLINSGKEEEALNFIKRAMRLDPQNPGRYLLLLGYAHFAMGQLEDSVAFIERSLTHMPEITYSFALLAAAYAHLGRAQEAGTALDKFTERYGRINLLKTMTGWRFNDPEVAERLANGLLMAGLPGEPSKYYKISNEHQIKGEEIENLLLGRTESGFDPWTEKRCLVDWHNEEKITIRGAYGYDSGRSWIEGDMVCRRFQQGEGMKFCGTVFRNPEGTHQELDEYIMVYDQGVWMFSVTELADTHEARLAAFYDLKKPEGSGPFPAVVAVPGCSGFYKARSFYAKGDFHTKGNFHAKGGFPPKEGELHFNRVFSDLRDAGFVTIRVDYLSARNLEDCFGVTEDEVVADIFLAIKHLLDSGFVKDSSINVLGWSYGGGCALQALSKMPERPDIKIAAVSAYYPNCRQVDKWSVPVPVLLLLAGKDNACPTIYCKWLLTEEVSKHIQVKEYAGAYHAFDISGLPPKKEYKYGTIGYNKEAAEKSWSALMKFLVR